MTDDISKEMERNSSAVTLSDMEVFIFPELMYSLVLANIMSPRIWRWRDDPWFEEVDKMKPRKRIARLKQYIIDHYMFNLDLDTWGLTTKEQQLDRFKTFIDEDVLKRSNALFGYEGDKYYFDIDIRTHFGLDKYEGNVIPYWKTETVEAMDAFKYCPDYDKGAGECVSLAALYAAALFIVARIPLESIYLMATPLHSQNFVDVDDGILTNNRRLVTKNMWFNGTELSGQARRALENERVTIIAHESGFVHTIYDEATMSREACDYFSAKLKNYLKVGVTKEILGNFLRNVSSLQKCFQVRWEMHGDAYYIGAERIFAYEHGSTYRYTDNTRDKLMTEIASEEFRCAPIQNRTVLNDVEDFISSNQIDLDVESDVDALKVKFDSVTCCMERDKVVEELIKFCHVKPMMPDITAKQIKKYEEPLGVDLDMTRDEVIARLEEVRQKNDMAGLAFYAYRDLSRTDVEPFMKAAVERNPVCVDACNGKDIKDVFAKLTAMPDGSIYDGAGRLAQPDEVWNYGRGDGVEKAVMLAAVLRSQDGGLDIQINVSPKKAIVVAGSDQYEFASRKELLDQVWNVE